MLVFVPIHRPLLEPVETLLQMLLMWDPTARGGGLDPETNKPHCYTILQNILNMKVNHMAVIWTHLCHCIERVYSKVEGNEQSQTSHIVHLFIQAIHVLDMTSAQLHSLVLSPEESLHSLQLRLELHTQAPISPLSQELLLETGISLDPRRPPAQCLPDGLVREIHTHTSMSHNI